MVRSAMLEHGVGGEAGFRWRGREVTRLEGLSDAVFGFAAAGALPAEDAALPAAAAG